MFSACEYREVYDAGSQYPNDKVYIAGVYESVIYEVNELIESEDAPFRYKIDAENNMKRKPISFYVTKEKKTEPPFENAYWNHKEKGIYVDIDTNTPLFSSKDKFTSDCGWPCFTKPIDEHCIQKKLDLSHFMIRTEVISKSSHNHLGHVFQDGPEELGGKRYCINSAALKFIPKENMKEAGFISYLDKL